MTLLHVTAPDIEKFFQQVCEQGKGRALAQGRTSALARHIFKALSLRSTTWGMQTSLAGSRRDRGK